ncbi:hypothetical protein SAMN03080615_01948 [Amphritea atlantica]|uniref:Uncharacterized protein n=1 Tax=Amphritea atlantica TaxID=355243 RepID=A0A1H9H576_9GAMM|nr:hypothetical protein SAMN03080615_01948 [Amphritea atlantica]
MNFLRKIIFSLIFLCVCLVGWLFFTYKNLAYVNVKNLTSDRVELKLNGDKYFIDKYMGVEVSPLSGRLKVEFIREGRSSSKCDLEVFPFRLCYFELYVRDDGVKCYVCDSM